MHTVQGPWSLEDDKSYRGRKDRIFVSKTEEWEIEYFIDHFLKTHHYKVDVDNRKIVLRAINEYPGKAPIAREDLTTYLERRWPKKQ